MAIYPCDIGGHRYRGGQQTLYPALVCGRETQRRRLRLCSTHFERLMEWAAVHAYPAQEELEPGEAPKCPTCRGEPSRDGACAFFLTAYAAGSERQDYWAPVCADCAPRVAAAWSLVPD